MTRWRSLNRPKFSGFRPGCTLASAIGFVRPLSGAMLNLCSRPTAADNTNIQPAYIQQFRVNQHVEAVDTGQGTPVSMRA